MISLPNNSDFANLREHAIDLNNSFFFFNSYKRDIFSAASCEYRRCLSSAHKGCACWAGAGRAGRKAINLLFSGQPLYSHIIKESTCGSFQSQGQKKDLEKQDVDSPCWIVYNSNQILQQ